MHSALTELQQARRLPYVAKAVPIDQQTILVELRKDVSWGLRSTNILYFPSQTFTVDQLQQALNKIRSTSVLESSRLP